MDSEGRVPYWFATLMLTGALYITHMHTHTYMYTHTCTHIHVHTQHYKDEANIGDFQDLQFEQHGSGTVPLHHTCVVEVHRLNC